MDWPPLLSDIAEALGLKTFHVLGVSGGGPYALVSAWALPDRVAGAGIVSGAPPLAGYPDRAGLFALYRLLLALHDFSPGATRALLCAFRPLGRCHVPRAVYGLLRPLLPRADAQVFRNSTIYDLAVQGYRTSWEASASGVALDAEIYATPWGFALDEIGVPVSVWHGDADRNFSHHLAARWARTIPRAQLRIVGGEGHFSLFIGHGREILSTLTSRASDQTEQRATPD